MLCGGSPLLRAAPANSAGPSGPFTQGGYELDARRATKPTADPIPVGSPRLLVPDNVAVEVRHTVTSSAPRPKPKAKPAADPQPSPFPSVERADPAPLGAPRPKPKAFAALRHDAVVEEPIEVASDF